MSLFFKEEFESFLPPKGKNAILTSVDAAEVFGVQIYLIGGIVRDLIMKKAIKDIDIAVEGDAIKFAEFLSDKYNCKIDSIQENLRTAKVIFANGIEIDFASTREEKYESSGRLPVAFNFGCPLKFDVKRRDFTINTLAIKLTGNNKFQLTDIFNGYNDIKNKKIAILHDNSFIDDPSRIIRALKFKERFDFDFDENTHNLMMNYLENPNKNMPLERIKSELKQFFSIEKKNIYNILIKENAYKLISDNPIDDINLNNAKDIEKYELYQKSDIPFMYLCALIINSDISDDRLNFNSLEKKILIEAREMYHNKHLSNDEQIYKCYINKEKLSLAVYYFISNDETVIKFIENLSHIKVYITGQDLIDIGLKPSKIFAQIFDTVLKEKIKGSISTKEEELNFVKNLVSAKFFIQMF